MATRGAHKRLTKEYKLIQESPIPFVEAVPSEVNILEWHYVISGPPDTPYAGGEYHGTLVFPADYPFKPPAIRMITPSGRFSPNTRLCLSISDYHPKSWNPAWSVSTILTGLLSFMVSDEHTAGSITTSPQEKKIYAAKSHEWNVKRDLQFCEHFPELVNKKPSTGTASPPAQPFDATSCPDPIVNANGNSTSDPTVSSVTRKNSIEVLPTRTGGHGQKILCVCVLLASWLVASRFISHG